MTVSADLPGPGRRLTSVADAHRFGVSPDFDHLSEAEPRKKILLLSSPRTGSTLVSEWLRMNGCGIGFEYLARDATHAFLQARGLEPLPLDQYLGKLIRLRQSPNGIFLLKVQMPHLLELALESQMDPLALGLALTEASDRVILVDRRDKLRQASSLVLAETTGQYAGLIDPTREFEPGPLDVPNMLRALKTIRGWDLLLARLSGLTPRPCFRIEYEQLAADPEARIRDLFAWLGETIPDSLTVPDLPRQRGHWNRHLEAQLTHWLEGENEPA